VLPFLRHHRKTACRAEIADRPQTRQRHSAACSCFSATIPGFVSCVHLSVLSELSEQALAKMIEMSPQAVSNQLQSLLDRGILSA
jgi:hypothetical protein